MNLKPLNMPEHYMKELIFLDIFASICITFMNRIVDADFTKA